MQLSVSGKQLDVGDALKGHVSDGLSMAVAKYFDNAIEAHVVFSRVAHRIRADISVHVGRGIIVQGHEESDDPYAAFDGATDRIAKRLRRYKSRLRDHHRRAESALEPAHQYVLAPKGEDDAAADGMDTNGGDAPVIIAESSTEIQSVTVGEAVMMLDLADMPALMFRNAAHGGLNMIYRRPDGNIGWVDPRGTRERTRSL